MTNVAPYEVVAQPFTLWLAPVGTTFPLIDAQPSGSWTRLGTLGDRNYSEDGITFTHSQSQEVFRALGSTGPRKAFRVAEEQRISLVVVDLTLEAYKIALNGNTIGTVAQGVGISAQKEIGLSRGRSVTQYALLLRAEDGSPYMDGPAQYEIPVVVEAGEAEVVFTKGEPAGLALEFNTLEDPSASTEAERFGRFVAATGEPGT